MGFFKNKIFNAIFGFWRKRNRFDVKAAAGVILNNELSDNQQAALDALLADKEVCTAWDLVDSTCQDIIAYNKDDHDELALEYPRLVLRMINAKEYLEKSVTKCLKQLSVAESEEDSSIAYTMLITKKLKDTKNASTVLDMLIKVMHFKPTGKQM